MQLQNIITDILKCNLLNISATSKLGMSMIKKYNG